MNRRAFMKSVLGVFGLGFLPKAKGENVPKTNKKEELAYRVQAAPAVNAWFDKVLQVRNEPKLIPIEEFRSGNLTFRRFHDGWHITGPTEEVEAGVRVRHGARS